jgi:hypothetical protein
MTNRKPASQRSLREDVDQFKVEDFPVDGHSTTTIDHIEPPAGRRKDTLF